MPIAGLARQPVAAIAAILVAAAILTLPAALGPARFNDSFWIDWVWLDQFADAHSPPAWRCPTTSTPQF